MEFFVGLNWLEFYGDHILQYSFIHSFISIQPQKAGLAGTRVQSCDRYGSGTLHPGQVLGGSLPLLSPTLDVPTFAARCLYVRKDARDPSNERWNCGRERCPVILPKFRLPHKFMDLLHALNLRHGTDETALLPLRRKAC